ncbi:helix-turn-helix domain-containing protein [Lactobacillus amylovorus]|jgi:DNA-binding Xre family transcriptional regulator|uniref:helix-turn-helix domain-containing protein n=1 Tax=Lactobacillus amylovorus TaxID=1604 RepID=UPI001CC99107
MKKISYAPLFRLLKKRKIKQKDFWIKAKISGSTRQKLRTDKCITTNILVRICNVLDCELDDIVELIK